MLSLISELNIIGIIAEIAGFIIILFAVKMVKASDLQKKGSFSAKWDELVNIMSTLHKNWNYVGIRLVILGLVLQLINAIYT
jgi:hypothetical protein